MSDFRESACLLVRFLQIGYYTIARKFTEISATGTEVSVDLISFGEKIEKRESQHGDVLGFWHSHPEYAKGISGTDIDHAKGFSFSYGKNILMIIETDSGWSRAWYVDEDGKTIDAVVIQFPLLKDYFLVYLR